VSAKSKAASLPPPPIENSKTQNVSAQLQTPRSKQSPRGRGGDCYVEIATRWSPVRQALTSPPGKTERLESGTELSLPRKRNFLPRALTQCDDVHSAGSHCFGT